METRNVRLAFQPVMQGKAPDHVAFYEGLLRLIDTDGKIIPAREFIEQIEATPLGRKMDALALALGFEALEHRPDLRLAINMSARSIRHPLWMAELERGLRRLPPLGERLIIEITESSAMEHPDMVRAFMSGLQERGISFAIDDFGAGQSSLRYMREFRFDILKIDRQFIDGIAQSPDNRVLTAAIIMIAQQFEMLTVAEGVETEEDAACLCKMGIDCLQGYHFGMPTIFSPWQEDDTASILTA